MSVNYAGKNLNKYYVFYILFILTLIAYLILRNKLIYKKNNMLAIYQKYLLILFLNL